MKLAQLLWSLVIFCSFVGCIPVEDGSSMTLSFWTDREIVEGGYKMIFINDIYLGDLDDDIDKPVCDDFGLLNYEMKKPEDLHISVYNSDGESVELGFVNLFSISTGIKIKPTENSEIFVDRSLDDECTLVYLNWPK